VPGLAIATGKLQPDKPAVAVVPDDFAVERFSLVRADTGEVIAGYEDITDDTVIDLGRVPTSRLSILARTRPERVGSVRFSLTAKTDRGVFDRSIVESVWPFYAAGDKPGIEINAWTPKPGRYTLQAVPFEHPNARGRQGAARRVNFQVNKSAVPERVVAPGGSVVGFTLIDVKTGKVMRKLVHGSQVTQAELESGVTIRADVVGDPGSVRFLVEGAPLLVESVPPFVMSHSANGVTKPIDLLPGQSLITAVPFEKSGAAGTMGEPAAVRVEVVKKRKSRL